MAIKKGDLVKVIKTDGFDEESYGIIKGETYKVVNLFDDEVYINAGKGDRVMYYQQLKKVKKDLRIKELENTIKQIQNILNK